MIYYDLTELYYLSRGSIKFYGIAKVVDEIAYELSRLAPEVVFVAYDESRDFFFELTPDFSFAGGERMTSLGVEPSMVPKPLYTIRDSDTPLRQALIGIVNTFRRYYDRKFLKPLPKHLSPVDMQAGILFSAGRPKLIARIIDHIRLKHTEVQLYVLLHDAIPLHGKQSGLKKNARNFRDDTAKAISHANMIIANSQFTLNDLQSFSERGVLPPLTCPTDVMVLAHECRGEESEKAIPVPQRQYVLGVGITLGRKNLDVLLHAQEKMLTEGKIPPLLVIAGKYRPRMVRKLKRNFPTFEKHVLLIDSPSQPHLIQLYRHAVATVMASRLEGWGLPAGESLWLGTPVILARTSSLPEVGGDLALYFDPDDADTLSALLEDVMEPAKSQALRQSIALSRNSLRSWKSVTEALMVILKS